MKKLFLNPRYLICVALIAFAVVFGAITSYLADNKPEQHPLQITPELSADIPAPCALIAAAAQAYLDKAGVPCIKITMAGLWQDSKNDNLFAMQGHQFVVFQSDGIWFVYDETGTAVVQSKLDPVKDGQAWCEEVAKQEAKQMRPARLFILVYARPI